ncbi:hypothetical protein DVH05_027583 [Phytophthora capsici]|nr:hypothetical protein DVH05_027583 [Phytophthora capsici]
MATRRKLKLSIKLVDRRPFGAVQTNRQSNEQNLLLFTLYMYVYTHLKTDVPNESKSLVVGLHIAQN